MKHSTHKHLALNNNHGAVIALVAIVLFVLLGVAAFAIDFGYRHVVRNELQNAADAAALAAASELGVIYSGITYEEQQTYVFNPADIVPIAQEAAMKNYAGNITNLTVNSGDVVIGDWDFDASSGDPLTVTLNQPDAVRVTTRRDGSANGPISTFFARIFNVDTMGITARATAALSGQGTAGEGDLTLPIGISKDWFDSQSGGFCGQTIAFSPSTDPDACAGWTTFTDKPAQNNKVKDILDGDILSPFTDTSTSFEYLNGDLSEGVFESLMTAFQNEGYDVDSIYNPDNPTQIPSPVTSDPERVPLYDDDGVTQLRYPPCQGASGCTGPLRYAHEWQTTVVVYDSSDCTPSQDIRVAGFVQVVVYNVGMPSDKTVKARIQCDYVEPGPTRGGGGDYGTKGSVPGLVE